MSEIRAALRSGDERWTIGLINGPNMSNLGNRPKDIFGTTPSLRDLVGDLEKVAAGLGVELRPFASNFEGEIVEWVHAEGRGLDGILINPAGLTSFGLSTLHAVQDTGLPVVEVHMANLVQRQVESLFTAGVTGTCHGFRQHTYRAALVALVGMLDEGDPEQATA